MNTQSHYPETPGYQATDTSQLAAAEATASADRLRSRCLTILRERGSLTSDELAGILGESILSIRPRVTELRRMGKVRDTGLRRPSSTGHSSAVVAADDIPGGVSYARPSLRDRLRELEQQVTVLTRERDAALRALSRLEPVLPLEFL